MKNHKEFVQAITNPTKKEHRDALFLKGEILRTLFQN